MTKSLLHQWLESHQEGGAYHSEGEFTVNQQKAWRKLGSFQFEHPEAWVLKLYQAAVAADCSYLEISQTETETRFSFHGWNDCSSQLTGEVLDQARGTRKREYIHLAVALRSLAQNDACRFRLRYPDGECLLWTGKAVEPQPGRIRSEPSLIVFHSPERAEAARTRANICRNLSEFCHLGPTPIKLDSRELPGCSSDPVFGISRPGQVLLFATAPEAPDQPKLSFAPIYGTRGIRSGNFHLAVQGPFCKVGGPLSGSAACLWNHQVVEAIFASPRAIKANRSELIWLTDGVVVKRDRLEGESGLAVVLSADGLDTDLSGMVPLDTPLKGVRALDALARIKTRLEQLHLLENPEESHPLNRLLAAAGDLALGSLIPADGALLIAGEGAGYLSRCSLAFGFPELFKSRVPGVLIDLAREIRARSEKNGQNCS